MFHQYVLNFNSVPIDIDRAVYLMDKKVWFHICAEMAERREKDPQVYWDLYCDRHREKYGVPFSPQVRATPL